MFTKTFQKAEAIQSPDGVETSARDTLSFSQQVFAYTPRDLRLMRMSRRTERKVIGSSLHRGHNEYIWIMSSTKEKNAAVRSPRRCLKLHVCYLVTSHYYCHFQ